MADYDKIVVHCNRALCNGKIYVAIALIAMKQFTRQLSLLL
jgi:hypothetical protein